jgi:hypothetical protein
MKKKEKGNSYAFFLFLYLWSYGLDEIVLIQPKALNLARRDSKDIRV